ncbi:ferric-dicitrate binding protein FerR (iron transport regulator) [Mucilaginibacter sp. SG538B]|uniref:FecR family protein n=1 Tax=Mucilaginibacter sp. SG538B TaxID=2587021 RepID=UPI00159E7C5F|nr:FecR family protein [Mucilaginibacter sp. SG538B]NVM66981.1 ferric-dicitrate binding protein FerR (iron transport regulator) [Mucilaginibacter sp. SG538B]
MDNSKTDSRLRISDLISKYLNGNLSGAEHAELFSWVEASHENSALFDTILNENELENRYAEYRSFNTEHALAHVKARLQPTVVKHFRLPNWLLAAAAAIILCMAIGIPVYLNRLPQQTVAIIKKNHEIAPGGNKAILTLANGSKVVLNSAGNGNIASQGNTTIKKLSNGVVAYNKNNSIAAQPAAVAYNTMSTPRGGQYHLILADGTNVWLNAASSIKFPVVFNGNERKVQITGEAYFEVAHDKTKPFRVESDGQTVEVLGTHFNINAYADENEIKTTLLQGSVRIKAGNKNYLLKPGEQSHLKNGDVNITQADMDEALAWKNGVFHFNDAGIESVMKQISRWYDVDVKYEGKIKERTFSGEISMNVNASQILDAMRFKKIHYTIEGKTITVRP